MHSIHGSSSKLNNDRFTSFPLGRKLPTSTAGTSLRRMVCVWMGGWWGSCVSLSVGVGGTGGLGQIVWSGGALGGQGPAGRRACWLGTMAPAGPGYSKCITNCTGRDAGAGCRSRSARCYALGGERARTHLPGGSNQTPLRPGRIADQHGLVSYSPLRCPPHVGVFGC